MSVSLLIKIRKDLYKATDSQILCDTRATHTQIRKFVRIRYLYKATDSQMC